MIALLLVTAPMCHAVNFSAGIFSSKKEQADDKEVKNFEDVAHSAHKTGSSDLVEKLKEAESLMIGLANHKKAYEKSNNPRQAARTQSRINRLSSAIGTIKSTLEKLNKSSHGKHTSVSSAPRTSSTSALSSSPLSATTDLKDVKKEFAAALKGKKLTERESTVRAFESKHTRYKFDISGKVTEK